MTQRRLETLLSRLRAIQDDGTTQSGGTLLIAKLPPRPDGLFHAGYLHEIYAPLDDDGLAALSMEAGREIPEPLQAFYRQANGLSLFCGSFSIGGSRTDYSREPGIRLPVSLRHGNAVGRPVDAPPSALNFGFFADGDGHSVWMDANGEVYMTPMQEAGPRLRTSPDLWTFVASEVERLSQAYVARGGRVDPLNVLPAPVRLTS